MFTGTFSKKIQAASFSFLLISIWLELVGLAWAGLENVAMERVEWLSSHCIGSSALGCIFWICSFPVSSELLDSFVGSVNMLAMRIFKISFSWIFEISYSMIKF